jgi:hypothetical protein
MPLCFSVNQSLLCHFSLFLSLSSLFLSLLVLFLNLSLYFCLSPSLTRTYIHIYSCSVGARYMTLTHNCNLPWVNAHTALFCPQTYNQEKPLCFTLFSLSHSLVTTHTLTSHTPHCLSYAHTLTHPLSHSFIRS